MIFDVLKLLENEINAYFKSVSALNLGEQEKPVTLQNIARIDDGSKKDVNKLVLTLVNIAEEPTMKNHPGLRRTEEESVAYGNPPVHLNLYVLVSACVTDYEMALKYLTHVILFFQGKQTFTSKNSIPAPDLPDDFHVIVDLYPLSFEQSNFLWSTLGGKQYPFVCYKLRLLRLERESTTETRGIIKQIRVEDAES